MDVDALTRSLQDFLAESPEAVVVEGGEVIFDFTTAKYACRAEHGKCLLHLWSEEAQQRAPHSGHRSQE